MYKTAIILSGILALAWSQSTSVSQCRNNGGVLPSNTYLENCITPPCQFPQGQDAVMHLTFVPPYTINSMTTLVTAYFGLFVIPFGLGPQAITCNYLTNTACPVQANQVVAYTLRMYIDPSFPAGTTVYVEVRITDDNNNPVFCFRVQVTIVAPALRVGPISDVITSAVNKTMPLPMVVALNTGY